MHWKWPGKLADIQRCTNMQTLRLHLIRAWVILSLCNETSRAVGLTENYSWPILPHVGLYTHSSSPPSSSSSLSPSSSLGDLGTDARGGGHSHPISFLQTSLPFSFPCFTSPYLFPPLHSMPFPLFHLPSPFPSLLPRFVHLRCVGSAISSRNTIGDDRLLLLP